MKKSRFLSGRLFAAVIMSALSGGSFVSNAAPVTVIEGQAPTKGKEAIAPKPVAHRPVSRRNIIGAGDANELKHNKRGFLDQKRKRKKLRSNASFARSKKCTTKRK